MKLMIASDIHGSAKYGRELINCFESEQVDRLLLLGDILYHGPRNDPPDIYAPKEVIKMLNDRRERILCVRGNCDTEVDQTVLDFPILSDYCIIENDGLTVFATHGHKYNEAYLPPLSGIDVLLCGHTHVPACVLHEEFVYLNPGSVSIPKAGSERGYMVFENGLFTWKDLSGNILKTFSFRT